MAASRHFSKAQVNGWAAASCQTSRTVRGGLRLRPFAQDLLRPAGLLRGQRRNGRQFAIADAAEVGAGVVAAVEDGLKIDGYRGIARQEWDVDLRERVLEPNRLSKRWMQTW
jgi:hypothetical protein